jgi:D-tyrosyl-tRNA(Tyr) deacylase
LQVVQRVIKSSVEVDGKVVGEIRKGVNILLGVAEEDTEKDVNKLVNKRRLLKIIHLCCNNK